MQSNNPGLLGLEEIREDALEAAQHEVRGFVLHDERNYIEGAIHFGLTYLIINKYRIKPVSKENALLAGVHKMEVLKAYDTIVDDKNIAFSYTDTHIQNHLGFKQMVMHALEECNRFALPTDYGLNKVNWYMEHAEWVRSFPDKSVTNFTFLDNLKSCEKAFVETITGDTNLFYQAWRIYLKCVLLHDTPRITGLRQVTTANIAAATMTEAYRDYLIILFQHKLNKI